jgi:branched-chain amino acid transport system permease protein
MAEETVTGDLYYGDDAWGRAAHAAGRAWQKEKDLLRRHFGSVGASFQPLSDRWERVDPRVRVLWVLIPVVLVLLFPQETTSSPQAFSLIAIALLILLGVNGAIANLLLLSLAILTVVNMHEVPNEGLPTSLWIILPIALPIAYAFHLYRGTDFRLLCAVLVLGSLPLTLELGPSADPRTFVLFLVAFNIVLGLGLNVVVGYAGLLDLGFVAFFAIGGYTWALMSTTSTGGDFAAPLGVIDASFWVIIPVAIFLACAVGILLGIPVLRLRGDYLAIVTLGFGEIIRIIATNAEGLTNGVFGIRQISDPEPFPSLGPLDTHKEAFYLVVVCALIVGFVAEQLRNSKVGRAWEAIREDEDVAQGMGINTVHYKLLAFGIGAAIGGLGGAIRTSHFSAVTPADFQLLVSINVLAIVIIGGMGSVRGVVLGAFILAGMPEILRDVSLVSIVDGGLNVFLIPEFVQAGPVWLVKQLPWGLADRSGQELRYVLFGLGLVVMMILRPQGLSPSPRRQAEIEMIEEERAELPEELGGVSEDAQLTTPRAPLEEPPATTGQADEKSEAGG